MWFLFLIAAIAGPAVVFYFARRGEDLRREQAQPVSGLADGEWPSVGLIIPAAGTHPDMENSIRSLLSQSYSGRSLSLPRMKSRLPISPDVCRKIFPRSDT